jgi:peptidoglycan/xylan/chitin deacetylase (PgdA/CDA1 family)
MKPQTEAMPPLPHLPTSQEWPGAGEALNLIRGPRGSHWVCMTFDGGSSAEVALDVLDALKERGIRTTFFLTGAFIQKYPDLVRRIDRDGHEIGNHTMDQPHFAPGGRRDPRWTKERFQQQLLQADSLLLKLLGRPMDPYWRAPYGENTAELRKWAEELGYRHVYWSEGADTLDWATTKERKLYRTGDAILDRLHLRMDRDDGDGLIVLMHLGSGRPESDRPARVLGPFLDKALDEGWNFVNISAYLKGAGKPRWNSSNRLAMLGQNASRQ